MDNLDLFVSELLRNNNLENLKNSIKAYNQLPEYFAKKYKSYIEAKGVKYDLWFWKPHYFGLNAKTKHFTLSVDFEFSINGLLIIAFIRSGDKSQIENYKNISGDRFPFVEKRKENSYRLKIDSVFDQELIEEKINLIIETIDNFIR